MDQQQWKRVNEIVDTALTLDGKEQTTFIRQECEGNSRLKTKVTNLLSSIEDSEKEGFLEDTQAFPSHLAIDLSEELKDDSSSSMVGETVDSYTILEVIGHGGMGSVFRAERADQAYEGDIALKIMRRGMDTPDNIARFKRERNILAKLDHPQIGRLLDGGVTESGLPYLVMEYVQGLPLHEYCDEHQLSITERLEIFESICNAVQQAHRSAIIHRDLKPSNILVTKDRNIKVLDFGIAKMLEQGTDSTFQTITGTRMLTLGYAAPEQIEQGIITTASDAYALGTLLYELLCGKSPFDIDNKDLTEIERLIRKKTPQRPSVKFDNLSKQKQQEIAKKRNTSPQKLADNLKGDLDAIVMKALRKESDARYRSAEQIIEELHRLNKNLPLTARKDNSSYKARKFIRRHKTGLLVSMAFIFLIIGFSIFYTVKITNERNIAQNENKKARQVKQLLTSLFRQSDPLLHPSKDVTLEDVLKQGSNKIQHTLRDQPVIKSELLQVLGGIYNDLGEYKEARPLLEESLNLQREKDENESMLHAQTLENIGYLNFRTGHYKKALELLKQALMLAEKINTDDTYIINNINSRLGLTYEEMGDYSKAKEAYNNILQKSSAESDPSGLSVAKSSLARIAVAQNNFEKATNLYQQSLAINSKILSDTNSTIANNYNALAFAYQRWGKLEKADSLHQIALGMRQKLFKPNHPHIASSLVRYGLLKIKERQPVKAEKMLAQGYQILNNILPSDHWQVLSAKAGIAISKSMQGHFKNNMPIIENVHQTMKQRFGAGDWRTKEAKKALILLYQLQGKSLKAMTLQQTKD